MASESQVAAEAVVDAIVPSGRRLRDEEMHLWNVNAAGKVTRFATTPTPPSTSPRRAEAPRRLGGSPLALRRLPSGGRLAGCWTARWHALESEVSLRP
jgi:hypothetical protein